MELRKIIIIQWISLSLTRFHTFPQIMNTWEIIFKAQVYGYYI